MRKIEIRQLEVDFDKQLLRINGNIYSEKAVIVTLPGPEGWPLSMLLNSKKLTPEGGIKLTVTFEEIQ